MPKVNASRPLVSATSSKLGTKLRPKDDVGNLHRHRDTCKTLVGVVAKDPGLQATRSRDTFQAKSKRPWECQRDTSTAMVEPIAEVNVCGLLGGMTPCKLRLNPTGYAAPSLSDSSCACSHLVATGHIPQAAGQTPVDPVTTGQGL
jgi:hypothetical protein